MNHKNAKNYGDVHFWARFNLLHKYVKIQHTQFLYQAYRQWMCQTETGKPTLEHIPYMCNVLQDGNFWEENIKYLHGQETEQKR